MAAASVEGTENFANHRVHSQQSSATSEEEGDEGYYRDLPSLISVEEVKTRLQDRCRRNSDQLPPASHQSTTDSLLDEVNSVIIEHIKEEEVVKKQGNSSVINGNSSRSHQLDQIASAIENLSAAAAAAGQIYTLVGGSNTLLESIEQLSQQQQQQRHSPSNTTATTSSIVSSVIIPNHTALGLGLRNGSEPTACFSPASVITHHQSSSSAFVDQSSTTTILPPTSLPEVEEINVEEEEMEEEKEMLEEEEDVVANENNEEEDEKMEEAEEEETDVEELQPTEVSHNSTNGLSTTTTEGKLCFSLD